MKSDLRSILPLYVDSLLDAVCVVDVSGNFLYVSAAFEEIFGYAPAEVLGRPMIELVYPDDRETTLQAVAEIMSGRSQSDFENRYVRKDGQVVHVMWSARWLGREQVRVAVARNVTARKHAEAMQSVLYAISEAARMADDLPSLVTRIRGIVSTRFEVDRFDIVFCGLEEGKSSYDGVQASELADTHRKRDANALIEEVIRTGQVCRTAVNHSAVRQDVYGQPDDVMQPYWIGVPLKVQGSVTGALVMRRQCWDWQYSDKDIDLLRFIAEQMSTVIDRKQMELRLQHAAEHDPLTDLPNRLLFQARLQAALVSARQRQGRLCVLYLDLDRFKYVNDTYGHPCGDRVLQGVALRLRRCIRKSDMASRVGGDEFLILLDGVDTLQRGAEIAKKVCSAIARPFELDGMRLVISASIGLAQCPEHGDDDSQLIRRADAAMYVAKEAGGNRLFVAEHPGPTDFSAESVNRHSRSATL